MQLGTMRNESNLMVEDENGEKALKSQTWVP